MIRIDFNRATGGAWHAGGFDGFGGDFYAPGTDAFFDLMRQMTDAGLPDDCAVAWDERGVRCWQVRSIHAAARRYRPTASQKAEKEAGSGPARTPAQLARAEDAPYA